MSNPEASVCPSRLLSLDPESHSHGNQSCKGSSLDCRDNMLFPPCEALPSHSVTKKMLVVLKGGGPAQYLGKQLRPGYCLSKVAFGIRPPPSQVAQDRACHQNQVWITELGH